MKINKNTQEFKREKNLYWYVPQYLKFIISGGIFKDKTYKIYSIKIKISYTVALPLQLLSYKHYHF